MDTSQEDLCIGLSILLRNKRYDKGWKLAMCARELGVALSSYCKWEDRKAFPAADKFPRLADHLGLEKGSDIFKAAIEALKQEAK